ncbi:MAG: hypothetical protein BWY43_00217 [candidate division WS2 bacterium ADurb.Bin280]|uniref:Glycosyltransferase 2-like domain-containing protein n=1 Tax=candidate division WS2 bacterium ADurb.Bin280 TaxID=1852829 RepID=A0A1V5SER0_9BACT|nr:MAG: hypothetical protein BWY43_00217 [candidate division WS2 bacterium ADurb.Bin280]
MKVISVVTPCYNEQENVEEVYGAVKQVFNSLKRKYNYEHIFIDNKSTDKTPEILRRMARRDKRVKVIFNSRNFGHLRSPYYGLIQSDADAVILLVCDFQDPPEMIPEFIKKWEQGKRIVIGVKPKSEESQIMFAIRTIFYKIISRISDVEHIKNFTGFGLYDKSFIEILRKIDDPYPYLRGLVAELGGDIEQVEFVQPKRRRGRTKNNLYTLYDLAILGFINYSKIPIRIASLIGFSVAFLSLLVALAYLVAKIIYWNTFNAGIAPLVIGFFFFSSVQMIFIGLIGEYVGAILTQVKRRPLVIEKERINF